MRFKILAKKERGRDRRKEGREKRKEEEEKEGEREGRRKRNKEAEKGGVMGEEGGREVITLTHISQNIYHSLYLYYIVM